MILPPPPECREGCTTKACRIFSLTILAPLGVCEEQAYAYVFTKSSKGWMLT